MIIEGTIEAFNRCGLVIPGPEEIQAGIGQKLDIAIKSYLPLEHKGTSDEVIRQYRQLYVEKDLEGTQFEPLLENIKPVLERLYQRWLEPWDSHKQISERFKQRFTTS